MEASSEQIKEYETQLADVEALLQATPDDAALLSLKKDLDELLALTRASLPSTESSKAEQSSLVVETTTTVDAESILESAIPGEPVAQVAAGAASNSTEEPSAATTTAEQLAAAAAPPKKKKLKIKDFEIPEHLKPKEGDTEAETNKKRRAVKKLKNKWREKKKEVESTQKQQSWQSFQSKKKRKDKASIFATQDGRSMTEFGERKRHKHS